MTHNSVTPGLSASLFRLVFGQGATTHRRARRRRNRVGHHIQAWDTLEGRIVPTAWAWGGGNLLGTLTSVGVVTGPVVPTIQPLAAMPGLSTQTLSGATTVSSNTISQLQNDWKALITDLKNLASKSGVTVGDVESLALDSQSIGHAGFHFDRSSLRNVITELATAVAGGTSTSQAQTDWTALFNGSSVSSMVITNTFNDLVTAIQDSNVKPADLSTVASDEAAIASDLASLGNRMLPPSVAAMGPSALLTSDPLPSMSVAVPSTASASVWASAVGALQSITSSLPVVSQPFIVSPGVRGFLPWGIDLMGSLTHTGVVTGPVVAPLPGPLSTSSLPTGVQNSTLQQLAADEKALAAELQSLAGKSGVTIAELQTLAEDSHSIAGAGTHIDSSALNQVVSELAMAVAGGTSTSQAQNDWNALFAGSTLSTTVITSTFNDLVATIGSSHVTTTDLTTVANDEAAIQTDLKNLFTSKGGSTGTGTTTSGSTSTHRRKPIPVVHKPLRVPVIHRRLRVASLHPRLARALRRRH
jgi:hypothetical protein